jgi:3-hydroxyacyl-CoA dehydrogenase
MEMGLDEKLTLVTVVGAAGKMGSGITLLLAQEMARLSLLPEHRDQTFRLNAVDVNAAALRGLQEYVHVQTVKAAEKTAVTLRQLYADRADLVENGDIIADYVHRVDAVLWPTVELAAARGSHLCFEAIVEKLAVKVGVLKQLKELAAPDACFFTNTSSVPIGLLDKDAGLDGRILGVHFYNPPAVQKLVEVIRAKTTRDEVVATATELGKRLRKTLIPSADIAGFIGNGHFIRDGLHGLTVAAALAKEVGWPRALYETNRVTQDWLLRPMGIFQLIDYVGIDVFKFIEEVMDQYLDEEMGNTLVDTLVERRVLGGQKPDGSQKPGFFTYERGKITSVYDVEKREYVALAPGGWTGEADRHLGPLADGFKGWKALSALRDKDAALEAHFAWLGKTDTVGAKLGREYLRRSREIGRALVKSGVAAKAEDVNGVLVSGFYHLYGPINDYCA